jgi:hypothetical protein
MTAGYSGYRVYEAKDGTDNITPVSVFGDGTTSYYAIVDPNEPYYFNVKAYEAGDSCPTGDITTSNDGVAVFSPLSTQLIIPAVPKNITEDITAVGSDWKIKLGWDASAEATKYTLDLSYNSSFSPIFETNTGVDRNYNSSNSFPSDRVIYYRIKAIYEKNGVIGTSDYTTGSITTGIPAPTDLALTHSFDPISGTPSPVPLTFTWTDNASNFPRDIVIEKSTDGGSIYTELGRHTVLEIGDVPEFSISVPTGSTYMFRAYVQDKNTNKRSVGYSNVVSANFVAIVKKYTVDGEGWMQTGGWLKFESVYITDDNKVRGHAWNPSFGWLDFDAVDSVKCPSGTCASYNETTGEITGWAQFKFADQTVPGWDGWVNLRGSTSDGSFNYGLCFGNASGDIIPYTNPVTGEQTIYKTGTTCENNGSETNNKVKGIVWGGPVVGGWIVFEDIAPVSLSIQKRPSSISYAPREHVTVWTSNGQNADWSGSLVSGSGLWGSISPNATIATTTFIAPALGNKTSKIVASTTAGFASTTLPIVENPYTISCTPQKGAVRVDWTKEWTDSLYTSYESHTLSLTYSTSSATGPWKVLSPNPSISMGSGSYTHNSLSTSTTYYYKLSGQFSDPSQTYDIITTIGCTAGAPVVDNPSRLRVYAQDMKTLLLNWKDNATSTEDYKFYVERIKLTPASSTQFGVTTSQALVTSQSVPLTWKNITTSTPFYMWIERSSTTDTGIRFANPNKKDPTYPGCSTANGGDPACGINKSLGVFRPVVVTTTNPKTFTGKITAFYDNDVVGRSGEATTFFYRIRACSSIEPQYTECTGSECTVNTDYRPIPACSPFTATSTSGKLIATTTPPLPVIQATTTKPVKVTPSNPYTKYKTTVQWKDDSLRETGVIVQRDGLTAIWSGSKIAFTNKDIYKNPLDANVAKFGPYGGRGTVDSFVDETLDPGTSYTYKIIPYYETIDPITGLFVRVLSLNESTTVGAQTPYRVVVGVDGDGSGYGYVTENTKNLDTRTSKIVEDFESDEQAVVEYHYISPNGEDYAFFDHWNGVSGCTTQQSCNTQRTGTVNATAEFRKYCYDLDVAASPSWCATVDTTGDNCSQGGSAGDFDRNTYADVDYAITSSTCVFTGWTGSCTGTGGCTVYMNTDRSVTARFSTSSTSTINLDIPNIPLFANIQNKLSILRGSIENLFNGEKVSTEQVKSTLDTAPVTSFTANAYSAITSFVDEIKRMVGGIFSASAATPNSDEDYFVRVNINPLSQPSYKDDTLEADTIYYYRVGIKYPSDSTIKKWSVNDGSGKTLPAGSVNSGAKSPICVRNSYCDFSLPRWDAPSVVGLTKERSEQQCKDNADCVNVGKKRQTTEEQ